jgi:cell wall-associated NlpC family hydrolase
VLPGATEPYVASDESPRASIADRERLDPDPPQHDGTGQNAWVVRLSPDPDTRLTLRRSLTVLATMAILMLGSTVGAHAWSVVVAPGDSGPDIHRLQQSLEQWRPGIMNGSLGGPTTARYGPRTLTAVHVAARELRGHTNPSDTYRVGPLFMSALDQAIANGGSSSSSSSGSTSTTRGQTVVNTARSLVGSGYQWGGNGPRYDCSGLVQAAWRSAGVSLPRTSYQQFAAGTRVSSPRLGDIAGFDFSGNGQVDHVGIYVGNGNMVDASGSLQRVVERPVITRALVGYSRP